MNDWGKNLRYRKELNTKVFQFIAMSIYLPILMLAFNHILGIISTVIFGIWIVEIYYLITNRKISLDILYEQKYGRNIFWVLFIAMLSLAVYIPQNWGNWTTTINKEQINKTSTQKNVYTYKSSTHGFTVDFASMPEVSNDIIEIGGYSVPHTSYISYSGNSMYSVNVAEYSDYFDLSDTDKILQTGLNNPAKKLKNGVVANSSFGTTAGYRSLSGYITGNYEGVDTGIYITVFLKGNNFYILQMVGETNESSFNSFENSFSFSR